MNELIRFQPTGKETEILYNLFKKYDIHDVLPIIQNYVNLYNDLLYYILDEYHRVQFLLMDCNYYKITQNLMNINIDFTIFNNICNQIKSINKDIEQLKYINDRKKQYLKIYNMEKDKLVTQKINLIDNIYIKLTPQMIIDILKYMKKHQWYMKDGHLEGLNELIVRYETI